MYLRERKKTMKEIYEAPQIEFTDFELFESIALSSKGGFGEFGI